MVIAFMPLSAASRVLMPFDMPSRRALRSEARRLRPAAVKKLFGLSRAELTFLPVDRRSWTLDWSSAVFWSVRRFERMLADNPDNPTGLLALANEYGKAGSDEDEAAVLQRYVAAHQDDEGNAYARLGEVLARLGRKDEARAAYERGIGQSEKFGHSGMAEDLRLALIGLNE